jgi:diacylglycerol kinase (ATP)
MATILFNGHSGGGTGYVKWRIIESEIRKLIGKFEMINIDGQPDRAISQRLLDNETFFIAAGGDGTVNYLLNTIAKKTNGSMGGINLGAIGIGSSNDYHKPFVQKNFVRGVHCKIDPKRITLRSAGVVLWKNGVKKDCRYWLNNASVGVTAEANYFFNRPNGLLSRLKKVHTGSAIMYVAVATILSYANKYMTIIDAYDEQSIALTNLGIVINPHVSGSFKYDSSISITSDRLSVHIMENMNTPRLLYCLYRMSRGKCQGIKGTYDNKTRWIAVRSHQPFAVEFDGEVIRTNEAEFSIKQRAISVCN